MILRTLFALAALSLAALPAVGQAVQEAAPRVVMNLAAHPDDEDGLTMAYYRYAKNAVVHSVIFNRGEGGQNEIGPELYAALGAIRTAETEAAARLLGTQVHFLNFDDFGFSKTAEETFEQWGGEEEVTSRLVYVIRKFKPDVLFTNHDTVTVGPRRQHGHHQVVGISAYRAMTLAGDPTYRPDQLLEEGVDLWQPQRLFLRLWRGGEDAADVGVPVGAFVPALGRSPMEVAVEAVAEHRSQGFDLFADRFRREANHFSLLWQAPDAPPLPPGADDMAAGLPPNPHAARVDLVHLIDSGRVPPIAGDGLTVSDTVAVPGQPVTITWNTSPGHRLELSGIVDTTLTSSPARVSIPTDASPTLPRERAQYHRFENHPPIQAALYSEADELIAAEHLPVEIAPPLVLRVRDAVEMPLAYQPRILLRPGENEISITGHLLRENISEINVGLAVKAPGRERPVALLAERVPVRDGTVDAVLRVELPGDALPGTYAAAVVGLTENGYEEVVEVQGHLLPEIHVPEGLRVGFVRSYDRATEAALDEIGIDVTSLDSLALAHGAFDGLHTIVVDIRAYLDRQDLRAHNDRLLVWVRDGGHLVVTYHKTFEWNEEHPDPFLEEATNPAGFAPLPLRLGRGRVTDARSPVVLLQPDHLLFNTPNRITPSDWEGWVQERGLYFPAEYDERYVELLAMWDPGEDPLNSSTLYARYGEGSYLYSALGLYRQLGAYVPGAYRLLANMVSLPLVDGRSPASGPHN